MRMKKKAVSLLLALLLSAVVVQAGVSRVTADAEPETITEETESDPETEAPEEEPAAAEEELRQEESEENSELNTESEISEADEESEEETEEEIIGMKITLENTLGETVVSIQVANLMNKTYSDNLLPEGKELEAAATAAFGIPEEIQDQELGIYNVRITLEGGSVREIPFVLFLNEVEGVLCEENGTSLIHIRDKRLEADAEPIGETEILQLEANASQMMAEALADAVE